MATRERGITRPMRRLGSIHHRRLIERDDTAHLMSSPEMVRRLDASMQEIREGRYTRTTIEELEARLGQKK